MFDLPQAKRVRRDELYSPATSPRSSPDPALTELLRSHAQDISFTTVQIASKPEAALDRQNAADEEDEEEELEFRLFAPTAPHESTDAPTQRIRIDSPDRTGKEGFVIPERPPEYYFVAEADEARRAQLNATAISGEEVLERAKTKWPGCEMPWRVTEISLKGMAKDLVAGHMDVVVGLEGQRQKRPGKKARIKTRGKAKEERLKRETAEKLAKDKEMAEKEKKARRNRQKQLKKRAKNRAKKAGDGDAAGIVDEGVDSGEES
ncbi:uncharacterized protein BDZ99DRAFT_285005 [Mytilinidion resinicola]|uniref:Uncharacterized protein n=1 Tax=Mytilinidion resinicola TaxID=574789 RepID=A0A6A6YVI5_9PEZI|nr:uncharacterized protein BDZ99DRAFT_285005 [Mytilinidion resinicola]KAF2811995.1 hypothetical protein BDZ99DRAFT_285005 [Mytilinidion resinicola]